MHNNMRVAQKKTILSGPCFRELPLGMYFLQELSKVRIFLIKIQKYLRLL